jgi:dihydrofolate reductase
MEKTMNAEVPKTEVNVIFASDEEYGIGKDNALPWPHTPEDMAWFKKHTDGHCIVMGRKTWESMGSKTLPNRQNVVLTSNPNAIDGFPNFDENGSYPDYTVNASLEDVIHQISPFFDKIWIIGGKSLIEDGAKIADNIYYTNFEGMYDCDVHVDPKIFENFKISEGHGSDCGVCQFQVWNRAEKS